MTIGDIYTIVSAAVFFFLAMIWSARTGFNIVLKLVFISLSFWGVLWTATYFV